MADTTASSLQITTIAAHEGELFRFTQQDRTIACCTCQDGKLTFTIVYDFKDTPLTLASSAQIGDAVCIRILPQRIELLIEGHIVDEEWPCGHHALAGAECIADVQCQVQAYVPEKTAALPCVLGTITQAEGWKPEENVFVGDCMPYVDGDRYHVLYLKDLHHHCSKWGLGAHQWEHISTADFREWQIHPTAVSIDDPSEASICTGSWIRHQGRHYLYYTIRTCDGSPASICRSVSEDGYHFCKDPSFAIVLSDRYTGVSARDPKIILDDQGTYHMLLTTSLQATHRGCLAHLVSHDLLTWQEMPEPLYVSPTQDEPECCDYFFKDGWYYLVFSLRSHGQYLYSRKPFSAWHQPADPIIPCKSVPKAATWHNRIIFTGFDGHGHYAGTMTFTEATVSANGELHFIQPFEI